jgi:hypothetical protein
MGDQIQPELCALRSNASASVRANGCRVVSTPVDILFEHPSRSR